MPYLERADVTVEMKLSYLKAYVDWNEHRGYFDPDVYAMAFACYACYLGSASATWQLEDIHKALAEWAPYALSKFEELQESDPYILRRAEFAGLIFSQHLTSCERVYELLAIIAKRRSPSITPYSLAVAAHTTVAFFNKLVVPDKFDEPNDLHKTLGDITALYHEQLKDIEDLWFSDQLRKQ
jgi:hypothetical protein